MRLIAAIWRPWAQDGGNIVAERLDLGLDRLEGENVSLPANIAREVIKTIAAASGIAETKFGASDAEAARIVNEIYGERQRQIGEEDHQRGNDDRYIDGELAKAAAAYATASIPRGNLALSRGLWPWPPNFWKPTTRRRNLIKAAALIVAEVERLDRAGLGEEKVSAIG